MSKNYWYRQYRYLGNYHSSFIGPVTRLITSYFTRRRWRWPGTTIGTNHLQCKQVIPELSLNWLKRKKMKKGWAICLRPPFPSPRRKSNTTTPATPCERRISLFSSALHSISHSAHSFTHSLPVRLPEKGGDRRESKVEPTNKYLCTANILT